MRLSELGSAIYLQALSSSKNAADTILKHLNRQPSDSETFKLQFCLTVPFLLCAAKATMSCQSLTEAQKVRVMDHAIDEYFADLRSDDPKDFVHLDDFLAHQLERATFLAQLPSAIRQSSESGASLKTSLHDIATSVFQKRFSEYQNLWNDDISRSNTPNFFPLLGRKVYSHWTGQEATNPEVFMFSFDLWTELLVFLRTARQVLDSINITA